ncbi:hypothetical protein [Streptomyces sp. NPDC056672]|uniref:hypothetical protein n=1 Tax=Streptomyces sp. NPDC056672 TaxID=3345906 RepID=UPI00367EE003
MRQQGYVRVAAVGLGMVMGLGVLAACGGAEREDTASALDEAQVRSVLPDAPSMPGWKTAKKASTGALDSTFTRSTICPNKGNKGCEASLFLGSASYESDAGDAHASLWMVAYEDEKAAEAGYDVLWKDTARKTGREKADLGPVGEERNARRGPLGYSDDAEAITGQIRVGTAILWLSADARDNDGLDSGFVQDIAALFAERARQAQNGQDPSAGLDDVRG